MFSCAASQVLPPVRKRQRKSLTSSQYMDRLSSTRSRSLVVEVLHSASTPSVLVRTLLLLGIHSAPRRPKICFSYPPLVNDNHGKGALRGLSLVSCLQVKANSFITNASVSAASHPSQRERALIDGVNIISIVMNFLPTTVPLCCVPYWM
jgi:hypothetical protein